MKKVLALVLAVFLCLQCVPTLAAGTVHYEDPDGKFSASVPAEWLCLNKHNIQNYITAMIDGTFSFPGIEATMLSALRTQIEMANMHFFICNVNNNMTIRCVDFGAPVTEQQFAANMLPQINQNVKASIPGIQYEDEGSVKMFGDKRFVATLAYYNVYGVPVVVDALYYLEGTKMYEITISSRTSDDPAEQGMFYEQVMNFIESFATKGESTPAVQPIGGLGEYTSFADNYKSPAEETEATQPEQIEAYKTYTHPTFGYSVIQPADWIAADKTNIQDLIAAAEAGEISVPGINMDRMLNNSHSEIQAKDCVAFFDTDGNYVVLHSQNVGYALTNEEFETHELPQIVQMYTSIYPGCDVISDGDPIRCGDREYFLIHLENLPNAGVNTLIQLVCLDGTMLHQFALTVLPIYDQSVLEAFYGDVLEMAATFTPAN